MIGEGNNIELDLFGAQENIDELSSWLLVIRGARSMNVKVDLSPLELRSSV
jgi:hypothetical protein